MRWVALLAVAVLGLVWLLRSAPDEPPAGPATEPDTVQEPPVVLQGRDKVEGTHPKAVPAFPDEFDEAPRPDKSVVLHGRVVLPNGDPAEGVKLYFTGRGRLDRMATRPDGRFRLRVPPDATGHVTADPPPPYLRTHGRLPAPEGGLEIVLDRGVLLDVQVLGMEERPVAGASAIVRQWNVRLEGRTDADGRVALDGIKPGTEFTVVVDGRHATPPHPYVNKRFVGQQRVVIRLPDPTYLEGRVRTPEGEPTTAPVVATSTTDTRYGDGALAESTSGRFRLGPLPAGEYKVHAEARGSFAGSAIHVARSPAHGIELVVQRTTPFRRSVRLPQGGSVDYVMWWFSDHDYLIAVDEHRPDGPWHIAAALPDAPGALYLRDFDGRFALFRDVRPSDVPGQVVPVKGGTISGTIEIDVSPDIVFRMESVVIPGEIDDGTFEIPGIPPGAKGVVQVLERKRVLHEVAAHEGKRDVRIQLKVHPDDE